MHFSSFKFMNFFIECFCKKKQIPLTGCPMLAGYFSFENFFIFKKI